MPDPVVHVSFGREVLASLPEEVRDVIVPEPYTFALFGPDVWFLYKPFGHHESRGRRMHTTKAGLFLTSLLRRTAAARRLLPRGAVLLPGGFLLPLRAGQHHPSLYHPSHRGKACLSPQPYVPRTRAGRRGYAAGRLLGHKASGH